MRGLVLVRNMLLGTKWQRQHVERRKGGILGTLHEDVPNKEN